MKEIQSEIWKLTVPDSWVVEQEDDMISLYDPEGNGSLVISTIIEDTPITDEYIEDMVSEHLDAGAELNQESYGPFSGVGCCFELEDEYWCEWYLCLDNVMLYITYNCDLTDEGDEDDVVEQILESLSLNPDNKVKMH